MTQYIMQGNINEMKVERPWKFDRRLGRLAVLVLY